MKHLKKYKYCLVIVLIGLIDIICAMCIYNKKMNFINNAGKTEGVIYTISNNENNTLLYVNYYVHSKKYNGIIVTEKEHIKISDKLTIYYDKNNPTKISDGIVKHNEYILIILGLVIILIAIFLFFNCKKEIEKEV